MAFTNRGARLVSWQLKRYRDAKGRPEEMVQNIPGGPRALDIETGDPDVDPRLREALFQPSAEVVTLAADGRERAALSMGGGRARGDQDPARSGPRLPGPGRSVGEEGRAVLYPRRSSGARVSATRRRPRWRSRATTRPRPCSTVRGAWSASCRTRSAPCIVVTDVRWVGVESTYFAALWVPPTGRGRWSCVRSSSPRERTARRRWGSGPRFRWPGRETALLLRGAQGPQPALAPRTTTWPRSCPWANGSGRSWCRSWPCCAGCTGGSGNYGWSIVVLTVLINVIMAPLRHYSHRQRDQDGEALAGDARDPGALPEGARARSEAAGDAAGDRGPLRAPRHEHEHADAGGLPAPAAHHAVPDRLLPRAPGRHRAARSALSCGSPTSASATPCSSRPCSWGSRCS